MEDKANEARMTEPEGERTEKRKDAERKKEFTKPTVEEEMEIVRIVTEKQEEEEYLIEIRIVEEMIPRRFHKYLEVFEKNKSERMLIRKPWDYTIDLRKGFVTKKGKIYLLSRIEREKV